MSITSDGSLRAVRRLLDGSTERYHQYESVLHCDTALDCSMYLLRNSYTRKLNTTDKRLEKARVQTTVDKWLAAEKHCFRTNRRLGSLSDFDRTATFLVAVGERVRSVIGDSPPQSLVELGRWSSGASCKTARGTHHSVKQGGPIAVTSLGAKNVPFFFKGLASDFEIVDYCRGVMVPKNAETHRVIACEPAANGFMQQAVHTFMRRRLKRFGVADLDDQSKNQDGAFRAMVDELATLDLASASDTVCIELVRWVLPHAWFKLLYELRSPRMSLNGKMYYLEKFSSMGNAFTFELETLIFWAIAKTVDPSFDPIVYGDDIIVRQKHCQAVIAALEFCGFLINYEKSFTNGRFFESCGKYYFDLEDVTPPFQKEDVVDVWSAMRAHNRLIRWGQRTNLLALALTLARPFWTAYRDFHDCLVPYGCELDTGFLVPQSAVHRTKSGDFVCTVLKSKPKYNWNSIDSEALKYKLYAPSHSCEHPKGYSCTPGSFETELRVRCVVWYANCV